MRRSQVRVPVLVWCGLALAAAAWFAWALETEWLSRDTELRAAGNGDATVAVPFGEPLSLVEADVTSQTAMLGVGERLMQIERGQTVVPGVRLELVEQGAIVVLDERDSTPRRFRLSEVRFARPSPIEEIHADNR